MIDRRRFLSAAAVSGLSSLMPASFVHAAAAPDGGGSDAFAAALREDPRLLGWSTARSDRLDCAALQVEGALPEGLRGVFRRNGPAAHDRHGLRYRHWFDADGMLQEFRFSGSAIAHRGRMIATPKLQLEDAAGRRLYPAFATPIEDGAPVRRPDDMNVANISVLDHHGELLALWEGGSPSLLDRDTLAWQGFKSWGEGLEGLPFTAHPKIEPDGTLWAFAYTMGPEPALLLYHIDPGGVPVKVSALPLDPIGMVHDFVVTERHLVIVVPPFVHDPEHRGTFLDAHVWRPQLGSRVLVVSKDDFGERRWYQLPAGFGFHHGNGWEERGGAIRFDHCLAADAGLVDVAMRQVMRGDLSPVATGYLSTFTLYPDGRTAIEESGEVAEFPQVSPRVVGRRNRYLYTLGATGRPDWILNTLARHDLEGGTSEGFDFGPGIIAEEHVFVPFPGGRGEDEGWLVGSVLDYEHGVSGVTVFDARRVPEGPVARAWLPYPLPLAFHGHFRTT